MQRLYLFLLLVFFPYAASLAAPYFVKFEASKSVPAFSVEISDAQLGPLPLSKYGSASFGPFTSSLPDKAVARWKSTDGENREQTINLRFNAPFAYDALKFFVQEDDQLAVFFVVRIGNWRNLDIPVNESQAAAKLRGLNESLHIAAGRGQLSEVRAAVEAGADINYLFGSIYPSPIRYAANGGYMDVVEYLLDKGARVRRRDLEATMLAEKMKELGREAE
jgi:hypothetical protein